MYNGEIVGVDLPAAVELTVTETEPGIQGDRVSGARKPATLQTGLVVQVPLFVNTGDLLKVDTRIRRVPDPGLAPGMTDDAPPPPATGTGALPPLRGRAQGGGPRGRGRRPGRAARPLRAHAARGTPRPAGPRRTSRIAAASVGWPLERMAVIDRLVLRLAVAELLDPDGPPTAVVIDEAVELAKTYSTDDSGAFVNGILSTIAAEVKSG